MPYQIPSTRLDRKIFGVSSNELGFCTNWHALCDWWQLFAPSRRRERLTLDEKDRAGTAGTSIRICSGLACTGLVACVRFWPVRPGIVFSTSGEGRKSWWRAGCLATINYSVTLDNLI